MFVGPPKVEVLPPSRALALVSPGGPGARPVPATSSSLPARRTHLGGHHADEEAAVALGLCAALGERLFVAKDLARADELDGARVVAPLRRQLLLEDEDLRAAEGERARGDEGRGGERRTRRAGLWANSRSKEEERGRGLSVRQPRAGPRPAVARTVSEGSASTSNTSFLIVLTE